MRIAVPEYLAGQPTFSRCRSAPKLMNLIFRRIFVCLVSPVNGIVLENSRFVADRKLAKAAEL
jgi:hypothetical protein